jgi:hypothetical protein
MKPEELKFISRWSSLLSSSEQRLKELAWEMSDSERYKQFGIPKSNGGLRIISEPISELKYIQQRLLYFFERSYEPLDCSHGFISKRSIMTNASSHVRKPWLFNMDIEKFFPTIQIDRIEAVLSQLQIKFLLDHPEKENEYSDQLISLDSKIVSLLANLCAFRSVENAEDPETLHGLPQGAPTSPIISDMVARGLDNDLLAFCEERGVEYTRYADDLSFSPLDPKDYNGYGKLINGKPSKNPDPCEELKNIFKQHGFRINQKKNKLFHGKSCKQVTGLTVNEFVNVPRKVTRSIRQDLHLWEKHGHNRANDIIHQRKNNRHKKCPKRLKNMLHGKLMFLSMVRGKGDPIYLRFIRRFRELEQRDFQSSFNEDFSPQWNPVNMWDANSNWRRKVNSGEMRFKVDLNDFPLRPAKHFADRRRIFLEKSGDLRAMLRTEVGAWAYERLQHTFDLRQNLMDEFTYDPFVKGGKCLLEYMLEAEASYLHLLHDDLIENQAHDAWSALFFRLMEINGDVCAKKLLDPAFRCHLEHIDWGTFFRHQNDEFLSRRYGYEKFTFNDLLSIASSPNRRVAPTSSLMLWTALAPMALNTKDEDLGSHRQLFKEVLEQTPEFFPLFDDVLTNCVRMRNGNPPSLSMHSMRKGIFTFIKAFGAKPINKPLAVI